ncbi:dynein beta chain, ciliary-like [Lucilia cuprina]|uniref:dynein beta chain, ciliary-like n=1 Tax=Lucilia cuprina TaxID=7375 RepID=UPI001F051F5A|nr:dynein beta chain, ciliary-like [Lucilia cuprina]
MSATEISTENAIQQQQQTFHNQLRSMTGTSSSIPENNNSTNICTRSSSISSNNDSVLYGAAACLPLSNDARLEFITSYTLTSLRLKHDKWHKMMATQEYQLILLDWLNNPQRRLLVMTLNPAGHLIPKNSINDLYHHNYATLMPKTITTTSATAVVPTTTTTALSSISVNATSSEELAGNYKKNIEVSLPSAPTSSIIAPAIATVAATAAMTAATAALLTPLPPPSSSFSTLDGVPRGKCVYFVKRQLHAAVALTRDNYRHEVIFGDFPIHSKIETLSVLFDEILQPLLQNSQNRKLWPEVVGKDLNTRMKDVRNTLTEIKGKTNNITILLLLVSPTVIEQVASHIKQGNLESSIEPKFRSLLEEMFINWTTQIHEILQEKSDCVHSSNTPAATRSMKSSIVTVTTPQQEINFWLNRQQNLQNIYDQLRESSHKSLAFILESIDSAYYPPFMKIFKRLIFAWQESKDITLWLQPLLRQMATFNAVNFCNAQELIAPLVHVIHLIWSNARHYRTTQRMTVLLRCICNLMVRRAGEDLEVSTLFHTEADEGLLKISRTIEILEMFKSKLLEYKTKYTSNQTILPALPPLASSLASANSLSFSSSSMELQQLWRFSNEDVFGLALNGFLEQLLELQRIFEAAVTFQSLEKLEIGGGRGKMLTDRIRQIHGEFKLLFEDWTKLEIDLGQPASVTATNFTYNHIKRQTFKREQILFFQRMHVLEKKLATILQQAYNDCHNWEQLTKLTTMFANIVQRQTIQTELMVILPHIFSVLKEELLLIETIVSEVLLAFEYKGVEAIPLEMNFPTIAGAMMWLENYMKRCDVFAGNELNALITTLLAADNPLSSQYEKLTARRDILTTKLSNLQLKIWNNWQQTIEKRIAKGLDSKVMMMTMSTMITKHQQQQQSCTSNSVENLAEAEGYPDMSIRCKSSDSVSKRNKKLKNTWLANNQAQSYSSPTNASAAYCHHVNTALTDKTDSTIGFLYNSNSANERFCSALAEDDVLNKSSFVSDVKILKINLSLELFTLLRETKYLLALQEIHKRQKQQGETTVTTTSSNIQLTTQLTTVSTTQQQHQQQQQQPHQLPLTLLDLYAQRDMFWQRKIKLMKIAEYYNSIREGLNTSNEMQLIQPVVDVIDELVECASKTLTWRNFDAELVNDIYKKTQTLHSRLHETRKNIQTILDSVRRWSREPLHQRSLYGKNLLELKHQKERLRTRVMQCEETKLLLNRLLIENFYLFFNYDKQERDTQDKNILEFLRLFPEHQRSKYISYLKSIDDLIYHEVKYAMKIRLKQIF